MQGSCNNLMYGLKQYYFDKYVNNLSTKQFWKTMKYLRKDAVSIPTLIDDDHKAIADQDKANMLSSFFSKCFNSSLPPLFDSDLDIISPVSGINSGPDSSDSSSGDSPGSSDDNLDNLLCTEEVLRLLQSIDTSKATGPDKISGKMVKATATSIAYPISILFNKSIRSGTFPTCWKDSLVVPIPKSNNHSSPNNYRPVSLLSILGKFLEKHVLFHY